MKYYSTKAEAEKASKRLTEQGLRVGIIREYKIKAFLSMSKGIMVYTLERVTA